jgi:hypothetical protein
MTDASTFISEPPQEQRYGKQPKDRSQKNRRRFERAIRVIKHTIDGADDMIIPNDVTKDERIYAIQSMSHSMASLTTIINKLTGEKEEDQDQDQGSGGMTEYTVMDLGPIEPARALTVNVIPNINDERLIREGEAAAAAYAKSRRENILAMARGLAAARRKYRGKQAFGRWFDSSPYPAVVTNKTMRAALIYIGDHEQVAARVIEDSNTGDPVAIAAKIKATIAPSSQNVKTDKPPNAKYLVALSRFIKTTEAAAEGGGGEPISDLLGPLKELRQKLLEAGTTD